MHPQIDDEKPPLFEDRLLVTEERIGFRLPEQYRRFLLRHNGGSPTPNVFVYKNVRGSYTDSVVDWFLAVYDGEYNNFQDYFDTYKVRRTRLPASLVPVGHDPGGNLVCISVAGQDAGAVYFWDHEEEPDGEPDYSNVYLVADSFDEFLQGLRSHLE